MNDTSFYLPSKQSFGGIQPPYSDFETARVVIVPVPYDSTTEWQSGTRHGPGAIIEASQYLELYDIELNRELHTIGIHTLPEVQPVLSGPEDMSQRVYSLSRELIDKEKLIIMLGGEHSLTLGPVRALKEKFNDLCVLQFDAHADLRDEYLGTKYSHACIMRRLYEFCPITQVGIRSMSLEEKQFVNGSNVELFHCSGQLSGDGSIGKIIASLNQNVYISIDLDVLDPSIMSAVGTPEPDGLLFSELMTILKAIAESRNIVGFDIMELCPQEGQASCAFLAAKLTYKLIGYTSSLPT